MGTPRINGERTKKIFVLGDTAGMENAIAKTLTNRAGERVQVNTAEELRTRRFPQGYDAYLVSETALTYHELQDELNQLRRDIPEAKIYLTHTWEGSIPNGIETQVFNEEFGYIGSRESERILEDIGVAA